jgi:hypothetical protein
VLQRLQPPPMPPLALLLRRRRAAALLSLPCPHPVGVLLLLPLPPPPPPPPPPPSRRRQPAKARRALCGAAWPAGPWGRFKTPRPRLQPAKRVQPSAMLLETVTWIQARKISRGQPAPMTHWARLHPRKRQRLCQPAPRRRRRLRLRRKRRSLTPRHKAESEPGLPSRRQRRRSSCPRLGRQPRLRRRRRWKQKRAGTAEAREAKRQAAAAAAAAASKRTAVPAGVRVHALGKRSVRDFVILVQSRSM